MAVIIAVMHVTRDNKNHISIKTMKNEYQKVYHMQKDEWIKLIGGGFAGMTAPFAVHPNDEMRAEQYLKKAKAAGLEVSDAVQHARLYLEKSTSWPTDIDEQLSRVRIFYMGRLQG